MDKRRHHERRPRNRRLWYAAAGVLALGTAYKTVVEPQIASGGVALTLRDECGEIAPLHKPSDTKVLSCSQYADRTTGEAISEAFLFIPSPQSARYLNDGSIVIGASLGWPESKHSPERIFDKPTMLLNEWGEALLTPETNRALCVADMRRVVEFVQKDPAPYVSDTVTAEAIIQGENGYNVRPVGIGENDPNKPDVFMYDAFDYSTEGISKVPCWTP